LRSPHLLLVVARGVAGPSRVGLTVSRKVGNAVRRNRIKRWLREVVRSLPPPLGGPWDLVFIPRTEAGDAGYWILREEVSSLFAKAPR
jgi:ribonuclease P protein component